MTLGMVMSCVLAIVPETAFLKKSYDGQFAPVPHERGPGMHIGYGIPMREFPARESNM